MTTLDNSFWCRSWTTLHSNRTGTNPSAHRSRKPESRVRALLDKFLLLPSVPHASLGPRAPPHQQKSQPFPFENRLTKSNQVVTVTSLVVYAFLRTLMSRTRKRRGRTEKGSLFLSQRATSHWHLRLARPRRFCMLPN